MTVDRRGTPARHRENLVNTIERVLRKKLHHLRPMAVAWAAASIASLAWAQSESPPQLQRVEVIGTAGKRYVVDASSSATKGDAPLLETPMAVQVVPREVLDDRQVRTSLDAIKNVSGVQSPIYEFYDQFLIRGFDSGYGTTFRNGLPLRGITNAVNYTFVDRVEVVKGPTSMLYGRVEPGGFVNIVTRKPQAQSLTTVELQAARWGAWRASVDSTGPASADGQWLYRIGADVDRADSWVENAHRDNQSLAASLAWRPNTGFDARVDLEHYDRRTTWLDATVPIVGDRPAPVPRSFTTIFPQSWTAYPYTVKRTLLALEWNLRLNEQWKLTQRLHSVHSNENQQGVYADGFDGVDAFTAVRFTHTGPNWVRHTLATNIDLAGEFTTGELKHRLLVGIDWSRFTDDTPGSTGPLAGTAPIKLFNPVYPDYSAQLAALAASDASNVIWRDWSTDAGLYVQDQVALGTKWELLVGGRFDRAVDAYADSYGSRGEACYPDCTAPITSAYPADKAFSPRAGLLYRIDDAASVYGSYSRSFGSSNGRDNFGNALKAQKGTQYELGIKAQVFDGRAVASATLFDLRKTNITQYDPVDFFPHVVGEARSRGLELDLAGQVSRHVSVIGSCTWDRAVITKDPYNGTEGKRFPGVATQVASLWTRYDSAPGAREGWAVGAGIYASSQRQGDDANAWQLPGYGRVDAMASYRTRLGSRRVTAQLNLDNVFDKVYFDRGGYGMAAYGAPRHLTGSLKLEF